MHVFSDLRPYICLHADCQDHLVTWSSRRQWGEHEFERHHHIEMWQCDDCQANFSSPETWMEHAEAAHEMKPHTRRARFALAAAERREEKSLRKEKCPL